MTVTAHPPCLVASGHKDQAAAWNIQAVEETKVVQRVLVETNSWATSTSSAPYTIVTAYKKPPRLYIHFETDGVPAVSKPLLLDGHGSQDPVDVAQKLWTHMIVIHLVQNPLIIPR